MKKHASRLLATALLATVHAFTNSTHAETAEPRSLENVMWDVLRPRLLGDGPVVVDDRIRLLAPPDAEDAAAVPVLADASALGVVEEIALIADLNPFPLILRFHPQAARPVIATRFKVQQATPLRAAARTPDGVWHLTTIMVNADGGGCTQPAAAYANADWADHVGGVTAASWADSASGMTRVRFRVSHPMDTGLADGIPAYFIDEMTLTDGEGRALGRVEPGEPVSENPVFTLEVPAPPGEPVTLNGRDNSGTTFRATLTGERGT